MTQSLTPPVRSGHQGTFSIPRNKTTKRIFIAATRMNDGKTTISLALFAALRAATEKVGFIKPVGQRFVDAGGQRIDEDSVLLKETFEVEVPIQAMNPLSIHPTFTRDFLEAPEKNQPANIETICRAFDRAAFDKEYIIIEGTGHAGVGSVFDLSNADVAKCLNAKVILIASGGIGRPIDEITLNKALFEKAGVEVIGAIINKVRSEKFETVEKYCRIALERMGIPLLGCIPVEKKLTAPKLSQVVDELNGRRINQPVKGSQFSVGEIIIAPANARTLLEHRRPGLLIVTSANDENTLLAVVAAERNFAEKNDCALVLTGNLTPDPELMKTLSNTQIPVIVCEDETYRAACKIHNMTVKTQSGDADKISIIKDWITKHIDLNTIRNAFGA